MKKLLIPLSFLFILFTAAAQNTQVYPTNWWVGMKWNKLQLMVHGSAIKNEVTNVEINYPGVKLTKLTKPDGNNYLFIDLSISNTAKPGFFTIKLNRSQGKPLLINYQLKERRLGNGSLFAQGVTSKDFIYFLMPDRFANGDATNDTLPGLKEKENGRNYAKGRHGGDIQGITQHLDYIKELGANTIWLTPVLTNDMAKESFHGYAFTNHYEIDPRFGGAKAYHQLIDAAHAKGVKIIQDAVYNHVGLNHLTVLDKPFKNWLHNWPTYQQTSFKDQPAFDPYAAPSEKAIFHNGWFNSYMPDLNQTNPYVANFLIQHGLWTVEEFGIDGWRIDTYAYNDLPFMNRCNKALMDEYPSITLFGETWVHGVPNQSYFVENKYENIAYKSNLQGATDFQMLWAIQAALNEKFGWDEGLSKLYTTLSQDYVYKDPSRNVLFLDNHDLDRFFAVIGKDINKLKQGLTWLLTLRGIPQLYYGTELLMDKFKNPSDAEVRKDFPGGWAADTVNKFTAAGRTENENNIFNYIKTLANYRLKSSALQTGKLIQYIPYDGLYVYFRQDEKTTVMVISSSNDNASNLPLDRFKDILQPFSKAQNIITKEMIPLASNRAIAPKETLVLELLK